MDVVDFVMRNRADVYPELMTPSQVARRFAVDPKTVGRWAKAGRLAFILTPGGQRRFLKSAVDAAFRAPADKKSG